jgi:hypothetical protein
MTAEADPGGESFTPTKLALISSPKQLIRDLKFQP